MRQPNGAGSITKLTGKRRNPYMVRLAATYDDNREIRPVLGYYPTLREAKEALQSLDGNLHVDKVSMTLRQLYEAWSNTRAYTELASQTQLNYQASWKKRLDPVLGNHKVREIRTDQLQSIIDKAEAGGMSHSSISKDKALMTLLWRYAMAQDIVSKNYAALVELPANSNTSSKDAFSDVELDKIKKAALGGVPWADVVLILCYTGFRIQALLDMTPFAFDGVVLRGGVKTAAGKNRIVPVHPLILPYVKARAESGDPYLVSRDGNKMSAKYFRERLYRPLLDAIGVRPLNPHCCRHTFATLAYKAGIGAKERQLLLGHTSEAMTLHYTHDEINLLKSAIEKIS